MPGVVSIAGEGGDKKVGSGFHSERPRIAADNDFKGVIRIAELEGRLIKGSSLSFKVSEEGGVSVYGLGRFPVTLYLEQWDALLSQASELREFIEANKPRLKTKDQPKK